MQRGLQDHGQDYVYREIELPLLEPLALMMQRGMAIDTALLEKRAEEYSDTKLEIHNRVVDLVGRSVFLNDDSEIRHLLFEELGLPVHKQTQDGCPSTDENTLRRLRGAHPVVEQVLRWRKIKTLSQAIEGLTSALGPGERRIYATLDPLGAETGRIQCRSPNLQSLPAEVRDVVVAQEGHVLVEADFSQIEYRVLAQLCGDPTLAAVYRAGLGDLHRRTAALLYGIPEGEVSPQQRKCGKQTNFAILYGQTAQSLARHLGIDLDEAEQPIDRFWHGYPEASRWANRVIEDAASVGHVTSLYGRCRQIPGLLSDNPREVERGKRQAVNTVIQGTAADVFKLGLIRLYRSLPRTCRLVICVHDSVLLEVPREQVGDDLPLVVDIHVGSNWAECKSDATAIPAKQKPATNKPAKRRKAVRVTG